MMDWAWIGWRWRWSVWPEMHDCRRWTRVGGCLMWGFRRRGEATALTAIDLYVMRARRLPLLLFSPLLNSNEEKSLYFFRK